MIFFNVTFESDIFGFIAAFSILHSIVIGFFLIFRKNSRRLSSVSLGLMQISGAFILTASLLTTTNLYKLLPQLIALPYPFIFLSGFFSMIYFRSLLEKNFTCGLKCMIFAAGPAAGVIMSLPLILKTAAAQQEYVADIISRLNYGSYDWLVWGAGLIYNSVIIADALFMIGRYRKKLHSELSNTYGLELRVLSRQLGAYLLCWAAVVVLSGLSYSRIAVEISIKLSAVLPAVYLLATSYSFLFGLVRSVPQEAGAPKKTAASGKAEADGISAEYDIICEEMRLNRHYLDPQLSLPELAERTSFYRNELSEIINSKPGMSFYHFVNTFRVDHFKLLLVKSENANILDLAFESGFNSKGAFYNAFRRITGLSPKQFLREREQSGVV